MKGLGVPVENQYGLRPATIQGTNRLQALVTTNDLDTRGWLEGVTTFNFHPHLPHYAVTTSDNKAIHLLAQQPIDVSIRTRSRKQEIVYSICFSGCRHATDAWAISCWLTPRFSLLYSVVTKAWSVSGKILRLSEKLGRQESPA